MAVEGFRRTYRRWPTRVRLDQGYIDSFRELLTDAGFENLTTKLDLIADDTQGIHAEDELGGAFAYGQDIPPNEEPDVHVDSWLVGLDLKPYDDD